MAEGAVRKRFSRLTTSGLGAGRSGGAAERQSGGAGGEVGLNRCGDSEMLSLRPVCQSRAC